MKRLMKRWFQAVVLCSCLSGASETPAPDTVTVMSYNIWYTFDEQRQFEAAGRWLKEMNADVLGLEEVCYADEATFRQWAKNWGYDYAEILKPGTMSVALCAKRPIEVIEKRTEDMHHGLILCKVDGIYYLVTHLSPFRYEMRRRETGIIAGLLKPLLAKGGKVIVMGDMNTPSPVDAGHVNGNPALLKTYRDIDEQHPDYVKNLENGQYEFAAFQTLLDLPLIDAGTVFPSSPAVDTYPTLAGVPDPAEKSRQSHRIDFILLSPGLSAQLESFETVITPETETFSDHYPVKAVLKRQ